jgi:hypothetical protein
LARGRWTEKVHGAAEDDQNLADTAGNPDERAESDWRRAMYTPMG